jgi:hypothetical protein
MQLGSPQPQTISYLIGGAMLLLVMVLRFRNVGRHRKLRLETLWIVPAILGGLAVMTFATALPSPLTLGLSLVALAIGSAVGWQRGRLMEIHVDPETHELNQRASLAGMLFLVAIIAVRFGGRMLIESGVLPVHADPRAVTDVLLSFAVGLIGVARLEMFLRARRLLAEARAGTKA